MTAVQTTSNTTAVIGAGPYGLSVAAHTLAHDLPTQVFGEPMESWRRMPARMFLKSVWSASSLAAPDGGFSLDDYCRAMNTRASEPIALGFFVAYAEWFQRHLVPQVDHTRVTSLGRDDGHFRLELADGREMLARTVVVAVGVRQFAYVPPFADGLSAQLVSHTGDHVDLDRFRGARVALVGAGQSALECAALLHDEGARVEVIARGPVHWIHRLLYEHGGPVRHLLYPPSDVGPPVLNWLCGAPLLMSRLPAPLRQRIEMRAVRPAGAQWLRPRVEGKIPITAFTRVVGVDVRGDGLRLCLSDGTTRDVDHLMLGTGYRPSLDQVPFLDPALRAGIRQADGFPMLNEWFESSVSGLHFVGGLAGRTFGPICRFVVGAGISARQVAQRAAGGA